MAYAFPVSNEDEIKIRQEELRKFHYDARHHCYAWILGLDDQTYRANDDGEPNHSAGDPILGQIRSFELTNVLVVVVRYFGGTKLGVGGLINAYKLSTEDALKKLVKKEIFEIAHLEMNFPYDILSHVERLISGFEMEVKERDFQLSCKVSCAIKKHQKEEFLAAIKDLYTLEIDFSE